MVHIVKKTLKGKVYLYLQRSIYEDGRRRTEHVAYLGPEKAWTKKDLEKEIKKRTTQEGL